jgi:hypothetical protein
MVQSSEDFRAPPPDSNAAGPTDEENYIAHDPERFKREVALLLGHDLGLLLGQARNMPHYALIDGGQCPEGWLDAWRRDYRLDAEPLFLRTPEAAHHALGPQLVELPKEALGATHPLIESLAAGPGVWQALTLSASPLPILELHAHLSAFLGGVLDDGTEVLLRWYDAAIGLPLLNTLPEAARSAFMQPFAFWKSWDWHYRPVELSGPKKQSLPDHPVPVPIDEATLQTLSALNVVQSLIAYLEDEPPLNPDIAPLPMAPALKHDIAERELKQAQGLGLASRFMDQLAVLWFALHVHPDIWRHPHMREEGQTRFAKQKTMNWLLREHRLRKQGEQALARMGASFIANLKAARENDPADDPVKTGTRHQKGKESQWR